MDVNSIADAMRDINDPTDLPQAYTPGPIELQLRDDNFALMEEVRSLRQSIQMKDQLIQSKDDKIESLLSRLDRANTAPPTNPVVPIHPTPAYGSYNTSGSSSTSRLKTKDPDVWSGTRSTLPRFLSSCRAKFMIERHNFPDEISKIGYAGSLLGSAPADWWHTLFQRYEESLNRGDNPPVELSSFTEFSRALTTTYGDPDLTNTMERKLRALRQTASASTYAAEFQRIAGFLIAAGWTDRPLLSQYKAGLKESVKSVLVHEKPYPATLVEMIAASIRIDNSEYELSQDRKTSTQPTKAGSNQHRSRQAEPNLQIAPPPSATTTLSPPVTQNTAWGNSRAPSGPPIANDGTTPMELDFVGKKGPLTPAQRQHRVDNKLCMYCGDAKHYIQNCPKAPPLINKINFLTEIPESSDQASTNSHAQE
jgi:hypothetical protein